MDTCMRGIDPAILATIIRGKVTTEGGECVQV